MLYAESEQAVHRNLTSPGKEDMKERKEQWTGIEDRHTRDVVPGIPGTSYQAYQGRRTGVIEAEAYEFFVELQAEALYM